MRRASLFTLLLIAAACSNSSSRGGASTAAGVTSGATTTSGGTTTAPPGSGTQNPPVAGPRPGRWFKGDLHSHSAPYSQDADRQLGDDPGTCFFLGEVAGLDFMALTDHRTMDQTRDPRYAAQTLTILSGCEWGGPIHIGMAGLTQDLPYWDIDRSSPATINAQVQAIYDEVHRQGGVVTTNHPMLEDSAHVYLSHSFDAIEVWNAYWNFPKGFKDSSEQDVDDKVASLGLRAVGEDANPEIREASRVRGGGSNHQAVKFWEANLNRGRKVAAVGGGDRHSLVFPGLPTTYVHAEDQSRPKILEGIRKARTWVGSYDGPQLEFSADGDGDGVYEALIGDSVPLNRPAAFKLRVQNAERGLVEVIKNGQVWLSFPVLSADDTFHFTDTATSRTWWRVDVYEHIDWGAAQSNGFQILATVGQVFGQSGNQALLTIGTPLGFQVSIGTTRIPQLRFPHEYDKMLNLDRLHWGYARGAITSPIWGE